MRPTPEELMAGVRGILRAAADPELSMREAQLQLRRASAVLRDGRWNEAAFDVLKENTALADMLLSCWNWIGGERDRQAALAAWCDVSEWTRSKRSPPNSFEEANTLNIELRGALAGFIQSVAGQHTSGGAKLRENWAATFLELSAARIKIE